MGIDKALRATVIEERPNAVYAVALETRQEVLAHLAGMVERNFVRLAPGDQVEVELSLYDPGRGKIVRKI